MTRLGSVDVTHTTRVETLSEAWGFVMEKLEGLDLHKIEMTAQDWKQDDGDDWHDTYLVTVSGRVEEKS